MRLEHDFRVAAALAGALTGLCVLPGCGSSPSTSGSGRQASEGTGTVGMHLQVATGVSLSTVAWTIHNPSLLAADVTGSVDVSQSSTVDFVEGGLPAGTGYTIALSGTTSESQSCASSGSFSISTGVTTNVMANMVCSATSVDAGTGSVSVGGTVTLSNSCAAVSALSASPASINVGFPITLSAAGINGQGSTANVGFTWAATGGTGAGTFDSTTSASPEFTCTSPGTVTVTVTAAIPDGGDCANDTASVDLTCTSVTAPTSS